jgi:hypothetical protein
MQQVLGILPRTSNLKHYAREYSIIFGMHGHVRTRRHRILSAVGFIFIGLFVTVGTITLVLVAKGYDFDFSTKEIVQNGLLLIGSEPLPAEIFVDGVSIKETTPQRLTMPVGQHTVALKRSGFRDWQRSFDLGAGEVLWLNYPLMLPESLSAREVAKLPVKMVSESSLDSSHLATASGQSLVVYRTDRTEVQPLNFELKTLLPGLRGRITRLVWSEDNSRLLTTVSDGKTTSLIYLTVDDQPAPVNLTELLGGYSDIQFVPRQIDDFYGLRSGGLWRVSRRPSVEPQRIVEQADRFTAFEGAVMTWAAASQRVIIHLSDRSIVLDIAPIGSLLDMSLSRHDGQLAAAVSAPEIGTVLITAPGEAQQNVHPHRRAGSKLLFSPGAGYLLSYKNNALQVYDLERGRYYTYELPVRKLTFARWGTGAHIVAVADGAASVIFDFDGHNFQRVADAMGGPVLLSPDQEHILNFSRSSVDGQIILSDTNVSGAQ